MNELNFLLVDCETTAGGDGEDNEPIEVSYLLSSSYADTSIRTFRMRPEMPCLPSATVIHGMEQRDIDQYNAAGEVLEDLYTAFTQDLTSETYVLAYNAPFDIDCIDRAFNKYLGKHFTPKKVLDLLKLARKIIPIDVAGNHRLDTVYYFLYPDKLTYLMKCRQQHSAEIDVQLEMEVFLSLWKQAEFLANRSFTIDELVAYTYEPVELFEWPFGKHKGNSIDAVVKDNPGYIKWFFAQEWINDWPDLVYTLNLRIK